MFSSFKKFVKGRFVFLKPFGTEREDQVNFAKKIDGKPNKADEEIVVKRQEGLMQIENSQIEPEEHIEKGEYEACFIFDQKNFP